jgi:hypothetical protein
MDKHTPTPWTIGENDSEIVADGALVAVVYATATSSRRDNAELIIRSGNAHKRLTIALDRLTEWACTHTSPRDENSPHEILIEARAALELAKFGRTD